MCLGLVLSPYGRSNCMDGGRCVQADMVGIRQKQQVKSD